MKRECEHLFQTVQSLSFSWEFYVSNSRSLNCHLVKKIFTFAFEFDSKNNSIYFPMKICFILSSPSRPLQKHQIFYSIHCHGCTFSGEISISVLSGGNWMRIHTCISNCPKVHISVESFCSVIYDVRFAIWSACLCKSTEFFILYIVIAVLFPMKVQCHSSQGQLSENPGMYFKLSKVHTYISWKFWFQWTTKFDLPFGKKL